MKRWILFSFLILCCGTGLLGQSDSESRSDLQEDRDRVEADFESIKHQIEELRENLLDTKSRYGNLSATTSEHSDAINTALLDIDQLEGQLHEVESAEKKNRQERIRAEGLTSARLASLDSVNKNMQSVLDGLDRQLASHSARLQRIGEDLGLLQAEDHELRKEVGRVDGNLGRAATKLWMLLGGLIAGLFMGVYGFRALHRQIGEDTSRVTAHIDKTQQALRDESIQLDNKLIEILETQLHLLEEERAAPMSNDEEDHSLSLRVADELVRLEKNFSRMSEGTKGLKQLKASVTRIKDTLEANGYEVVELLGQRFDPGMKLLATYREDETLSVGEEVITRIIKPQVNFRGGMIQTAQVEVSQGTKEAI